MTAAAQAKSPSKSPKKSTFRSKAIDWHMMPSAWLQDVPEDLEENWLVKFVPEGQRVLVISNRHQTFLVSKRNRRFSAFKSHFPAGGMPQIRQKNGLTVLDCIFNFPTKTIFILDCLCWNSTDIVGCEASFRFYWLKAKFEEDPKLRDATNSISFELLDFFQAKKSLIQDKVEEDFITRESEEIPLNGVVFYEKDSSYNFEEIDNNSVCWLYAYMIPEKLDIKVPAKLMNKMPYDYVSLEKFLEKKKKKEEEVQQLLDNLQLQQHQDHLQPQQHPEHLQPQQPDLQVAIWNPVGMWAQQYYYLPQGPNIYMNPYY